MLPLLIGHIIQVDDNTRVTASFFCCLDGTDQHGIDAVANFDALIGITDPEGRKIIFRRWQDLIKKGAQRGIHIDVLIEESVFPL